MDIAALSIAMSTVSTQSAYGVAMLSKSLDQVSSMNGTFCYDTISGGWHAPLSGSALPSTDALPLS